MNKKMTANEFIRKMEEKRNKKHKRLKTILGIVFLIIFVGITVKSTIDGNNDPQWRQNIQDRIYG